MSGITLYEITDTLEALMNSLELCETPEQRAQCEAEIEQAVATQVKKVDDFCRFLAHLESQENLATCEIERLKTRKQSINRMLQRLEAYAVRVMENANLKKIDGDTSRLSLRQNPPAVEITDESLVPAEFKTITPHVSIDKRAIKKAIDGGRDVPGADLRFGTTSLIRR